MLAGVPIPTARYFVALIILTAAFLYFLKRIRKNQLIDIFGFAPIILLVYTFFVSIVSNTMIFPQPMRGWILACYQLLPILLVFCCRLIGVRSSDLINGILVAAAIVVFSVIVDTIGQTGLLSPYSRLSNAASDVQRIVIMKTEVSIALSIAIVRSLTSKTIWRRAVWTAFALATAYVLLSIMQSRLTIAAVLLATGLFVTVMLRGKIQLWAFVAGGLSAALILPIILVSYFSSFAGIGNYLEEDSSFQWRLATLDYYRPYTDRTFGIGFGVMSTGSDQNNLIAYGVNHGGTIAGVADYNFYIADLGILSAYIQFGYVGFILVAGMTLFAAWKLIWLGRRGLNENRLELGMAGCILLFYFVSPWPMNLFTLEWSAISGALFWSLAAIGSREDLRIRRYSLIAKQF